MVSGYYDTALFTGPFPPYARVFRVTISVHHSTLY